MLQPVLGSAAPFVEISNSEMQTFKGCRRRWWLSYYAGLGPKEKSLLGPLPLGTRIHNSLEAYYTTGDHPVDVYARLQNMDNGLFLNTLESQSEEGIKKFESESELGRIMVEGYWEWLQETNADAYFDVIGAEKKLEHAPEEFGGRVNVIGKVDLRVRRRSDGSRCVVDHKSAAQFTNYYLHAHQSEQLMLYTNLERRMPDEDSTPVDGGIYNLLKKVKRTGKAKPPFYERIDVRFNKKTLRNAWTRTLGTISDILRVRDALDAGADPMLVAYPTPKMDWNCSKCPFFKACHMFDDGSNVEAYLEDFYEKIDPNARYGTEANDESE
jgi:hypothetical protein